MKPCPHCGSRQPRTGLKCPSCSASVEVQSDSDVSVYKPSWLLAEKGIEDPKKRRGRKRSQEGQEPIIAVESREIPVVRLIDETYINGQFVETPSQALPPQPFISPSSQIAGKNYPGKISGTTPFVSNSSATEGRGEEIFAKEFWVQPDKESQSSLVDANTQQENFTPVRESITYSSGVLGSGSSNSLKGKAFTPTEFLDKSITSNSVFLPSKSKSSSRKWVVALCVLVVIAGSVVYVIGGGRTPKLDLPTLGSAGSNSSIEVAVTSFGSPIAASSVESISRSTSQLDESLFPISCTPKRDGITGYAYVVAAVGVDSNESIALSTLGNIRDCIEDRVAYLHDDRSALRVRIEGLDAERGLIWLRVPAPLPGQAVSVIAQSGVRKVGTYTNGVSAFLDPAPGISAPGAPVLVSNGTMVAIYGDAGTPLDLASACGTLLAC